MNSSKMMMTADDMEEDLSSQDSYEAKHPQQTYTSLAPKKRKYNEEERIRRWYVILFYRYEYIIIIPYHNIVLLLLLIPMIFYVD